jgi:hypothetical protein
LRHRRDGSRIGRHRSSLFTHAPTWSWDG